MATTPATASRRCHGFQHPSACFDRNQEIFTKVGFLCRGYDIGAQPQPQQHRATFGRVGALRAESAGAVACRICTLIVLDNRVQLSHIVLVLLFQLLHLFFLVLFMLFLLCPFPFLFCPVFLHFAFFLEVLKFHNIGAHVMKLLAKAPLALLWSSTNGACRRRVLAGPQFTDLHEVPAVPRDVTILIHTLPKPLSSQSLCVVLQALEVLCLSPFHAAGSPRFC